MCLPKAISVNDPCSFADSALMAFTTLFLRSSMDVPTINNPNAFLKKNVQSVLRTHSTHPNVISFIYKKKKITMFLN